MAETKSLYDEILAQYVRSVQYGEPDLVELVIPKGMTIAQAEAFYRCPCSIFEFPGDD